MPNLYLITPVFNDSESLTCLLQDLQAVNEEHGPLHVVIVEDGSLTKPVTEQMLENLPYKVQLITLIRNIGHQRAIAVGLSHVANCTDVDRIIIMDGDGEDRPEDIGNLLSALDNKQIDVVVAQRRKRQESLTFKTFYRLYKGVFRLLTGQFIKFGNFCAMTPKAAKRLAHMDELWMHFPATVIKSGLARNNQKVDRGKRYAGRSKMNLVSLITHGLSSVAVFSEGVLTRIILFCAAIAGTTILLSIATVGIKLFGLATPGWFTVAAGALSGLLVQTATIALVSLLIMINSRNSNPMIPLKQSSVYIDKIQDFPASSQG